MRDTERGTGRGRRERREARSQRDHATGHRHQHGHSCAQAASTTAAVWLAGGSRGRPLAGGSRAARACGAHSHLACARARSISRWLPPAQAESCRQGAGAHAHAHAPARPTRPHDVVRTPRLLPRAPAPTAARRRRSRVMGGGATAFLFFLTFFWDGLLTVYRGPRPRPSGGCRHRRRCAGDEQHLTGIRRQ